MQRDSAAQRRSGQENLTASGKRRLNWLQSSLAVAWGSLEIVRPQGRETQVREFGVRAVSIGGETMFQQDMFDPPGEGGQVIYTMTIRLKSGKVIRRANGRPFRIVVRPKRSK